MTKQTDEALKMAVEWFEMAEMDINDGAYRMALPIIKACKEALEQPSVAELNDEYLRDTHVEGLSQPAQEPVAWIVGNHGHCTTKKDWAEKYSNHITPLYINPCELAHPAPSWQVSEEMKLILGLEFLKWNRGNLIANSGDAYVKIAYEQHVFNKVVEIITKSNPAPSWQGLSDDEIDKIYFKTFDTWSSEVDIGFARAIEAKLKEKNNV